MTAATYLQCVTTHPPRFHAPWKEEGATRTLNKFDFELRASDAETTGAQIKPSGGRRTCDTGDAPPTRTRVMSYGKTGRHADWLCAQLLHCPPKPPMSGPLFKATIVSSLASKSLQCSARYSGNPDSLPPGIQKGDTFRGGVGRQRLLALNSFAPKVPRAGVHTRNLRWTRFRSLTGVRVLNQLKQRFCHSARK